MLTADLPSHLILRLAFGRPNEASRVDKPGAAVIALFFIGLSYAASVVIAFRERGRKLFLLRSLIV